MQDNERKEKVEEVRRLMKEKGLRLEEACRKVGVVTSTYSYWMRKFREDSYPLRSEEDLLKACDEVDALRMQGEKLNDACERVRISRSTYYGIRSKGRELAVTSLPEQPKKRQAMVPTLHTFNFNTLVHQGAQPEEPSQDGEAPMVLLVGKEASLNKALATLAQMWSR